MCTWISRAPQEQRRVSQPATGHDRNEPALCGACEACRSAACPRLLAEALQSREGQP